MFEKSEFIIACHTQSGAEVSRNLKNKDNKGFGVAAI